ncbi:MAG: hypothetical protein K6T94_22540 [Paenibacillus sp.]|nr:hypothetical protein [Paenibacillus sp.]
MMIPEKINKPQNKILKFSVATVKLVLLISIIMLILVLIPVKERTYTSKGDIIEAASIININELGKEFRIIDNGRPFYFTTVKTGSITNTLSFLYRDFFNDSKIEDMQESYLSAFDSLRNNYFISTQSKDNVLAALYTFGSTKRSFQVIPVIKMIYEETKTGTAFLEGDQLLSVDNKVVSSTKEYLQQKHSWKIKENDTHYFQVQRGKSELVIPVTYTEKNKDDFLTGIQPYDSVLFNDIVNKSVISLKGYEGNSAGLMLTLELLRLTTGEDFSKGKKIAGTGTMNADGTVGEIGSMDYKIKTADKNDVDIYLVPKYVPGLKESYEKSNEYEALRTAENIGTKMKIIPVYSVNDALIKLRELK